MRLWLLQATVATAAALLLVALDRAPRVRVALPPICMVPPDRMTAETCAEVQASSTRARGAQP